MQVIVRSEPKEHPNRDFEIHQTAAYYKGVRAVCQMGVNPKLHYEAQYEVLN